MGGIGEWVDPRNESVTVSYLNKLKAEQRLLHSVGFLRTIHLPAYALHFTMRPNLICDVFDHLPRMTQK